VEGKSHSPFIGRKKTAGKAPTTRWWWNEQS
jgi:hypothetical protein